MISILILVSGCSSLGAPFERFFPTRMVVLLRLNWLFSKGLLDASASIQQQHPSLLRLLHHFEASDGAPTRQIAQRQQKCVDTDHGQTGHIFAIVRSKLTLRLWWKMHSRAVLLASQCANSACCSVFELSDVATSRND